MNSGANPTVWGNKQKLRNQNTYLRITILTNNELSGTHEKSLTMKFLKLIQIM